MLILYKLLEGSLGEMGVSVSEMGPSVSEMGIGVSEMSPGVSALTLPGLVTSSLNFPALGGNVHTKAMGDMG